MRLYFWGNGVVKWTLWILLIQARLIHSFFRFKLKKQSFDTKILAQQVSGIFKIPSQGKSWKKGRRGWEGKQEQREGTKGVDTNIHRQIIKPRSTLIKAQCEEMAKIGWWETYWWYVKHKRNLEQNTFLTETLLNIQNTFFFFKINHLTKIQLSDTKNLAQQVSGIFNLPR